MRRFLIRRHMVPATICHPEESRCSPIGTTKELPAKGITKNKTPTTTKFSQKKIFIVNSDRDFFKQNNRRTDEPTNRLTDEVVSVVQDENLEIKTFSVPLLFRSSVRLFFSLYSSPVSILNTRYSILQTKPQSTPNSPKRNYSS